MPPDLLQELIAVRRALSQRVGHGLAVFAQNGLADLDVVNGPIKREKPI